MTSRMIAVRAGLIGAALMSGSLGASLSASAQEASQIPTTGDKVEGAPFEVKRDWGTFKLADSIAAKLKQGEKLNYVFSYQASGIPLFSPQYKIGFERGCKTGNDIMPLDCSSIAPVQNDPNQQVSQIEAKMAAGAIDCLSIEPVGSDAMTAITNKVMARGIPVFTVGVPSRGHEFTSFTQIPENEGRTSAQVVLKWMKDTGHDLKVFVVSGGDPAAAWARGRMKGFRETIIAAKPDAKFLNTEESGLNTSYDPGKAYDTYRTYLSAHPDVQFIQNVDIGAEHADRAIESLNREGKVFTIGWNVSKGQLAAIDKGIQVALFDQRWPDQAAFGGPACAQFLKNGVILPNTQTLMPVTKENTAEARASLDSIMGQP